VSSGRSMTKLVSLQKFDLAVFLAAFSAHHGRIEPLQTWLFVSSAGSHARPPVAQRRKRDVSTWGATVISRSWTPRREARIFQAQRRPTASARASFVGMTMSGTRNPRLPNGSVTAGIPAQVHHVDATCPISTAVTGNPRTLVGARCERRVEQPSPIEVDPAPIDNGRRRPGTSRARPQFELALRRARRVVVAHHHSEVVFSACLERQALPHWLACDGGIGA
jgi:hypothetical protein